jgi:hypothetical protein
VALQGGWRICSRGAGIAYWLVLRCLMALTAHQQRRDMDLVFSSRRDGLRLVLDGETLPMHLGDVLCRTAGVGSDAPALRQPLATAARQLHITLG